MDNGFRRQAGTYTRTTEMKKANIWLAGSCLVCAILLWTYGSDLEGTEFSGGRITGPLLNAVDLGLILFVAALLLSLFYRRLAAIAALVASLLCLPLYIYLIAPGPFRRVFPGEYSAPTLSNFVWNRSAMLAILSILVAAFLAIRTFLVRQPEA